MTCAARPHKGSPTMQIGSSLIGALSEMRGLTRGITGLVLGFFLWFNVHPAVAAIKDEIEGPTPARAEQGRDDEHFKLTDVLEAELVSLQARVKAKRDQIIKKVRIDEKTGKTILDITIIGTPDEEPIRERQENLRKLASAFEEQDEATIKQLVADKAHIEKHKLPDVIHERHAQALSDFKTRAREVQDELDRLSKATTVLALYDGSQALQDRIKTWRPKHHKLDPNNLPFRTPDETVRAPLTNPEALQKMLKGEPVAGDPIPLASRKAEITRTELALIEAEEHSYTLDRGKVEIAGSGAPVPAPGPEFLAETEDVQITPAIQDLAQSLHNHPVEIYNWVYNNIEYVPTYGSIQGSQLTLDKKAGNAFDTSSLLVALLRAANIPARYVYGTVDIPLDKAMNWVGGVTVGDAAQQLLGQGGIPHVGLTQGGKFIAIRMEHVWVEAWVDFYPSRGARNIAPDTWVPMDGAYKQYLYTEGLPLEDQVPFDAQTLLDQAKQGATVDEQAGFVQNLNQTNIQSQLTRYQQRLQTYIDQQNPDATVGDVIGAKRIEQKSRKDLAATLPNRLIARASSFAAIPDNRQSKFRYSLYASERDLSFEAPIWTFETETVKLGGQSLALSFVPATAQDKETIESYRPQASPEDPEITLEEFPRSLPAYAIKVVPEMSLGKVVVARGGATTLGSEMVGEGGFTKLNLSGWDLTSDSHVAGQNSAVGYSLGGISAVQLISDISELSSARDSQSGVPSRPITNEQLPAKLLSVLGRSYFGIIESFRIMLQLNSDVLSYPALSYGFFHAQAVPSLRYGIATSVRFPGISLDIGHIRSMGYARNNSTVDWINSNTINGYFSSAMEGLVPKLMFARSAINGDNVSAVGIIDAASRSGFPVYLVTAENHAQIDLSKHSAAVRDTVRTSVQTGNTVLIASSPVTVGSWRGSGLIVSDPETGSGAYLIEGGSRGGFVDFLSAVLAQPSLLLSDCQGSFLDMVVDNFVATNDNLWGLDYVSEIGLASGGTIAAAFNTASLKQVFKALLSQRLFGPSPLFIRAIVGAFLLNSLLTFLLVNLSFQFGVIVGSTVRSLTCRTRP